MITKLEDFLRRRSKIALVVRKEDIRQSPGLMEACEMLFGEEAKAKFEEYLGAATPEPAETQARVEEAEPAMANGEEQPDYPRSEPLNW